VPVLWLSPPTISSSPPSYGVERTECEGDSVERNIPCGMRARVRIPSAYERSAERRAKKTPRSSVG
jgi:hypothetical protein